MIKLKLKITRRLIENILSIILFFIAIYLIVSPFLPSFELFFQQSTDKNHGYVYQTKLADTNTSQTSQNKISDTPPPQQNLKPIPDDDRLVIPSIELDDKITEGPDARALHDGAWRRPNTSTPDKGGNTVLAGHRFTYNVNYHSYFYNLDKIKIGDPIIVYWQKKEYDYKAVDIKQVTADQVQIENNTPFAELTLYTCTPLWTAKDRLVVIAKPI